VAETEDLLRWATLVVASEIGKYDQHYYTISTKEEEWQAFVDSNVELPKIVFATYASVPRFHSFCEKQKIQLDFVVVDEAHLSAGDTKKTIHPLIDPRQTITSKFLFMTATEKIVHEKDVLRSMNCMSDKNVYGAYIARIDFRSLYNEGMQLKTPYICDYQVHCVLGSLSDYHPQNYVLSKTAQKEPLAIIQSHLACLNILKDAFDQGQVTHVIAYCSRIKDATLMKQLAQNAQNAENRVFAKDIKIFAISGSQSPSQRKRILNEYSSASKAIIFNVRVLQCGVDLPITNGIAFCSDITSTIQIVQMIMRGSRLYPGKKDFKVIVPCLIDSDEDFLQEGKGSFTQVRRVLVALTEEDPDLKEEALCLYQAGEYPTKQRILHKVCKSLPEIDLEVWMAKFKTHALTSNRLYDLNWEYKYQLCVKYVEEHQQLPPRKTPIIGSWCNSQRIKYKRKRRTEEQITKLESIRGWFWEQDLDKIWEENFKKLYKYVEKHHRIPPQKTPGIGNWCQSQREKYKGAELTKEQITKLNSIEGWFWSRDELWEENFNKLQAYVEEHHRIPTCTTPAIGNWCQNQRIKYKGKKLTEEQITKLESIEGWY
jgi:hypothetical protein